MGQDQDYN